MVSWKEAAERLGSANEQDVVVRSQRCLGNTEQDCLALRHSQTNLAVVYALLDLLADLGKLVLADDGTRQQVAVARIGDPDLSHHLTNDDLNVLIVDINTLHTINLLYLCDDVVLNCLFTEYFQHVVGVERTDGQRIADIYCITLIYSRAEVVGNRISFLGAVLLG